ncbi:MAG: hypothetical protein LUG98_04560 [Tannerellaceae bacterium]|nr:hypothetical protein [Tannerellaceae bacterium]
MKKKPARTNNKKRKKNSFTSAGYSAVLQDLPYEVREAGGNLFSDS